MAGHRRVLHDHEAIHLSMAMESVPSYEEDLIWLFETEPVCRYADDFNVAWFITSRPRTGRVAAQLVFWGHVTGRPYFV